MTNFSRYLNNDYLSVESRPEVQLLDLLKTLQNFLYPKKL